MEGYPETFEAASKLVNREKLPTDVFKQLRELRDKTSTEFHEHFKMFFETAANHEDFG